MSAQNIDFVLTGKSPLLIHADDVMAADSLEAERKAMKRGQSKAGDDRSPAWSWQSYLYHDGDKLVVPSENLMVSLRSAAATVIYSKQKSFKELSQSGLQMLNENLALATRKGEISMDLIRSVRDLPFMEQSKRVTAADPDFVLHVKRARVGQSKHVRVRPCFKKWTLRGTIMIKDEEITFERLANFFDIAGKRVGLCDWRPSSKTPGTFGTFEAQLSKAK